jgi:hypothetical protein
VSDQGPPTADADPARPARPVKKVAKKRPAGSKPPAKSGTKARAAAKPDGGRPPINDAQATTRGAIVIVVTVAIGLLIFWQGFSHETSETVATGPVTTTVPGVVDRDAAPPTTEATQGTTVPSSPVTAVPPAQVNVIVANSVDPSQTVAGPKGDELEAAGYAPVTTMDLAPYGQATSSVYYMDGFEPEAQAVASVLGLPSSAVEEMPSPAPTPMNTAQVLVVIGQDGV